METSITNIKRDPLPNSRGGLKFSVVRSKAVLLATIGFVFSYILSPYYYAGDQAFYRAFYFGVQNYNSWEEKYSYYKSILDAAEPAYLIIVNLVSPYIEKDLFFSVVNGLLYGVVCLFFLKKKRGLIFCLLMLVNYYLVVLDFSAERLKLGVFFVVLALLFDGYKRYVLILIACLCQFQLIIVAAAVFLPNAVKYKSHLSKKNIFSVILFAVVLMVVVSRLDYGMVFDHLRGKSEVYSDQGWGGYMAVVKPAIFFAGALFCSKDRISVVLAFLPILFAAYLFGSERFAIFAYFFMMFFAASKKPRNDMVVIPGLMYFGYGGIEFLLKFIEHGSVS